MQVTSVSGKCLLGFCLTCLTALLSVEVRQGRLGSAVAAQGVAVLGRDVGGQRGGRGQVAHILPLHGLHSASHPRQEGVAEQLAQQGILGEIIQELREVLRREERERGDY